MRGRRAGRHKPRSAFRRGARSRKRSASYSRSAHNASRHNGRHPEQREDDGERGDGQHGSARARPPCERLVEGQRSVRKEENALRKEEPLLAPSRPEVEEEGERDRRGVGRQRAGPRARRPPRRGDDETEDGRRADRPRGELRGVPERVACEREVAREPARVGPGSTRPPAPGGHQCASAPREADGVRDRPGDESVGRDGEGRGHQQLAPEEHLSPRRRAERRPGRAAAAAAADRCGLILGQHRSDRPSATSAAPAAPRSPPRDPARRGPR